jgi:hypothetical protein
VRIDACQPVTGSDLWPKLRILRAQPSVGAGYLTGGNYPAIAALLTTGAAQFASELKSRKAKNEAKKSGLYYLLKAETKARGR